MTRETTPFVVCVGPAYELALFLGHVALAHRLQLVLQVKGVVGYAANQALEEPSRLLHHAIAEGHVVVPLLQQEQGENCSTHWPEGLRGIMPGAKIHFDRATQKLPSQNKLVLIADRRRQIVGKTW